MKSRALLTVILPMLPLLPAAAGAAAPPASLSLQEYLDQARANHQGYRAASRAAEGAGQRSREAGLITLPQFSAEGQIYSDARPQLNSFGPAQTDASGIKLGLSQQFGFGVQTRLGYQLTHTQLTLQPGTSPAFFLYTDYYDAIPSLDVSVPLWKGIGGSETRATQTTAEASALATHFGQAFAARMTLFEAELAYWRLAAAREVVAVQKKTLERTRYLEKWATERVDLHLGDSSDLLQAKAASSFRELELKNALDEERSASQNFNSLRGMDPSAPVGTLAALETGRADIPDDWKKVDAPPAERADLLAAREAERLQSAQATQAIERNRPQVDLFGQLQLNGRGADQATAISKGWDFDHKTSVVGVRLVSTLDFWSRSAARAGAGQEREAAALTYDRKRFEQQQEFLDLRSKLAEAQARLKLAETLERIQIQKLDRERDKLQRGRSTTFQLIQFETDSATAQLGRIRSRFDVLRLAAQLDTFSPSPVSASTQGASPQGARQ